MRTINQSTRGLNLRMPTVFQDFQRNYDEVIDCISNSTNWSTRNYNNGYQQLPQYNLSETEEEFCAEIDLPGMSVEKIDLKLQKNRLIVTGERKLEGGMNGQSVQHSENMNLHFNCPIEFPQPIDSRQASAEYRNGVLKVNVKKAKDAVNPPLKINVTRR